MTSSRRRKMWRYRIGRFYDVRFTATPMALVGTAVLMPALGFVAAWQLEMNGLEAVAFGFVGAGLHWFSEIFHQLGHARAARRTGYPMRGIRLGPLGVLAVALYPQDEPELPAEIHIRRALGGPAASFLLALAAGVVALLARLFSDWLWWAVLLLCLDSFFVMTLGAFLPLGFTDGSTLLYWWPRRGRGDEHPEVP